MLLTSAKYERYLMRASRWDGLRAAPLGPLFGPPSGGPVLTVVALPETYVGFVDAGFLHAAGSKRIRRKKGSTRLQAKTVADWFRSLTQKQIVNGTFLRAYWYDGAFDPNHERFGDQRRFFDAIAHTPSVQLRLGHIAERRSRLERPIRNALVSTAKGIGVLPDRLTTEFDKHWTFRPDRQQKGVDTLIALDMVRLAGRSAFSTAVLIAGDRDLAEVVRTTQDFGVRTIVATPNRSSLSTELAQLADEVITIEDIDLERMLEERRLP